MTYQHSFEPCFWEIVEQSLYLGGLDSQALFFWCLCPLIWQLSPDYSCGHVWIVLIAFIGEGNGNPLQYSCLKNPVDRGAWWAAVYGIAQSWTWLKRLSMHAPIGEGNNNPLQCSCLENPRDRRAWWAAIYGVTQSRRRLKQLSSNSSNLPSLTCIMRMVFLQLEQKVNSPKWSLCKK